MNLSEKQFSPWRADEKVGDALAARKWGYTNAAAEPSTDYGIHSDAMFDMVEDFDLTPLSGRLHAASQEMGTTPDYLDEIHPDAHWDSPKWKSRSRIIDMPLRDLGITQEGVTAAGVQHYYDLFDSSMDPVLDDWHDKYDQGEVNDLDDGGEEIDKYPRAVLQDGIVRSRNGHHRIAAAAAHGFDSMPTRVYDVDAQVAGGLQGVLFQRGLAKDGPNRHREVEDRVTWKDRDTPRDQGGAPDYGGRWGWWR